MRRWILFALLLFNGISAVVAGSMLIHTPDGSSMMMPLSMLEHSPFQSFRIPGLLLFSIIGLGSLVAATVVAVRPANTARFAQVAGGALIIWIVVQMIMLRSMVPIQITFLIIGIAIVWLAERLRRA
jgi:hypothetical protein